MTRLRARPITGQSLTDYVLVVGVVTMCMAGMQTFVRRYAQAEVRAKTDELLAITTSDATNPDIRRRGMDTQRRGAEFRRPGSGFSTADINDPALGGDYSSKSEVTVSGMTIREEAVGDGRGKMRVAQEDRIVVRHSRDAFQGYRRQPPEMLVKHGRWFNRDEDNSPVRYGANYGPDHVPPEKPPRRGRQTVTGP